MDGQTPYLLTRYSLILPFGNGRMYDISLTNQFDEVTISLTLISPSPAPLTKNSSCGSSARHLIADSCAWNLCLCCRCRTSNILISPFLPPLISNWCCGARIKALAPWSWHMKPNEAQSHRNYRKNLEGLLFVRILNRVRKIYIIYINIVLDIHIIRTLYKRFVLR